MTNRRELADSRNSRKEQRAFGGGFKGGAAGACETQFGGRDTGTSHVGSGKRDGAVRKARR